MFINFFLQAAFGLNLNIILEHNDTFLQAADKMLFGFDFKISNPFFKVNIVFMDIIFILLL